MTPNAPLKSHDEYSIEYTINYLIQLGAPPEKLVVGLPFYGRTFVSALDGFLGDATDSHGFQGPYTREIDFMGYNEICVALKNSSFQWESRWNDLSTEMLLRYRDSKTGKSHSIVYDTPRSIIKKSQYIIQRGLAGAMAW